MGVTQFLPEIGLLYWFAILMISDCFRKLERYTIGASEVAYKPSVTKLGWGISAVGLLYLFDSPIGMLKELSALPLLGWVEAVWFQETISSIAPLHHLFYLPFLILTVLGIGILGTFPLRAVGAIFGCAMRAIKIRQTRIYPGFYVFPRLVIPELLYILDRQLTFLRYRRRHSMGNTTIARHITTWRDNEILPEPEWKVPFAVGTTLEGLALVTFLGWFIFNNYSAVPGAISDFWGFTMASMTATAQAYVAIPSVVPIGLFLLIWGLVPFLGGGGGEVLSVFEEVIFAAIGTIIVILLFPLINVTRALERLPTVYSTLDYISVIAFVIAVWELSLRLLDPEVV